MSAARFGVQWNALWLAMLAGVALQLHERALAAGAVYVVATIAGLLLAALVWCVRAVARGRVRVAGLFMVAIAGTSMGFGLTGWQASARLADALPAALEDRDLQVTGVVAGLPQVGSNGLRFVFEVEQALRQGQAVQVPERVVLGWYSGFHEDAVLTQPQTELRAGQRWRFTVRLRQPHGNLNPHGFDYELQLFEQGIRATGQVRDGPVLRLADAAGYPVQRLRQWVRDAIQTRLSDRRAAGVLAALAVGDQAAIERDDWALFRQTGVAHLMSISGLHVTMFAWLAGALIGAAWRRSGRLMAWLPAPTAALLGGLFCALAYAVFAGWGVPAQRTVWMLATVAVLRLLGLRWPWPMVLLGAAVVVAAFDPWALLQPGFWLSFAAVGLLMACEPAQRGQADVREPELPAWRRASRWLHRQAWGGLRTQAVATIGLAPLTLLFFQQLSLVGFVANLIAIPLVTLVITPLALLGSIAAPLWSAAAWALQGLTQCLAWFASWPGAVWTVPAAPGWAQAAALLAALLLLAPLPWRVRLLALPLALPLLWPPRELPPPGHFELLAADVGQGTAVLVRTRGHLLVYDAGPVYSRDSNAGQRVLLPLLRARGETRIDTLLLSHRDADHVGGARALLDATPVGELLSSLEPGHPLLSAATAVGARTTRCESGQAWDWDGVRFTLLHPQPGDYLRPLRPNAVSCVLRVEAAGGAVALLTGDIERDQEQALVAAQAAQLRADVLMAPHHGSKTSSTPAFLSTVRPTVVVVQAGHHNRFGHPAAEVLQRYLERGTRVQATPACGAWRWASADGTDVCERQLALRYWHHGASFAID